MSRWPEAANMGIRELARIVAAQQEEIERLEAECVAYRPKEPPTTDELVERGMKIVHRLQKEHAPAEHATPPAIYCAANPHADTHCWHWRGNLPTIYTETQADCCWCGAYRAFGYEDILQRRVSIRPRGAFHGIAHVREHTT